MSGAPSNFSDNFIDAEKLRRWRRERSADDAPLPPRFSLLAVMAISTGAAVYCGLLRLLGVYGVMLMLFGLVALRLFPVADRWRPVKRVVGDMLAGIVLPIGCLAFDPAVFRSNGGNGPFSFADQIAIYTLLGTEMLVLFVWLLVGGAFNRFGRALAAGALILGSLICIALGIVLGLLGLGLFLGFNEPIGLLGFVPWFTLAAFMGNARRTRLFSGDQRGVVLGAVLGIVLPLVLAAAVGIGTSVIAPHAPSISGAAVWGPTLAQPHH